MKLERQQIYVGNSGLSPDRVNVLVNY